MHLMFAHGRSILLRLKDSSNNASDGSVGTMEVGIKYGQTAKKPEQMSVDAEITLNRTVLYSFRALSDTDIAYVTVHSNAT
jgi:hypothetical protein